MSLSYKELLGIGGEASEFEWNIFPGFFVIADSTICESGTSNLRDS